MQSPDLMTGIIQGKNIQTLCLILDNNLLLVLLYFHYKCHGINMRTYPEPLARKI